MTQRSPFRYFRTSPQIIRLAVKLKIRFPFSLRNVEDLLHERGIEVSHETVRFWWRRFGPMFAAEIRRKRVSGLRSSQWRPPAVASHAEVTAEQNALTIPVRIASFLIRFRHSSHGPHPQ